MVCNVLVCMYNGRAHAIIIIPWLPIPNTALGSTEGTVLIYTKLS